MPKVMAGTIEGKRQEDTLRGTQLPLDGPTFISWVTNRPEGLHERGCRGASAQEELDCSLQLSNVGKVSLEFGS